MIFVFAALVGRVSDFLSIRNVPPLSIKYMLIVIQEIFELRFFSWIYNWILLTMQNSALSLQTCWNGIEEKEYQSKIYLFVEKYDFLVFFILYKSEKGFLSVLHCTPKKHKWYFKYTYFCLHVFFNDLYV